MKERIRGFKLGWVITLAVVIPLLGACDKLGETSSGGGGEETDSASDKTADSSNNSNNQAAAADPDQANTTQNNMVKLNAFKDFKCSSNWTNRDGGLGLKVGSGQGTCRADFPGGSGRYRIELAAQTEREGQSPYRISINGTQAGAGKFPFSQGKVNCNCHRQPWQIYCPDVVMNLDAGTHEINTGDIIEYYGEEEYLCGKHGAYSKWRGMVFTPVN